MRSDLRGLKPYRVEKPEVKARLDANESPYDLPAALKERLARRLLETPLNRYPDSGAAELKEALARRLGADPAQIAVGNGSDELIAALILAVAAGREDARVIAPFPHLFDVSDIVAGVGRAVRIGPADRRFRAGRSGDAGSGFAWRLEPRFF